MRNLFSSLMVVSLLITPLLNAQERYVDDIFSDVSVEQNVVYGANIGIITQAPALEDLQWISTHLMVMKLQTVEL